MSSQSTGTGSEKASRREEGPNSEAQLTILDHGYVKLIDVWGRDESIIEAARMSTDGAFRGWGPKGVKCSSAGCDYREEGQVQFARSFEQCPACGSFLESIPGDEKLLKYLYDHKHMTPFEMAGFIIEVKAPIMVFREWHRHRTQSYNEMSARYIPLPEEWYVPSIERLTMSSTKNKQAGSIGGKTLTMAQAAAFQTQLNVHCHDAALLYRQALDLGVPKELARLSLPVNWYSKMRASANLRNWLAFMTLRCDTAAQWEIQQYAWAVANIVEILFPRTYSLWNVTGPTVY